MGRWLQEAAVADALDAGLLRETAWVIRRTALRIGRAPRFAEQLELQTWCSGMAKSVAERTTSIRGALGAAVDVEAIWVHIDPMTRLPARLPEAFAAAYAERAAGRRPRTSLRHPTTPPPGAEEHAWSFVRADVDIAGHVNNTMYLRVAEEHHDPSGLDGATVEVEYRAGIGPGPARVTRSGGDLWIASQDGTLAATIRVDA